ncbi:hypothetical protein ACSBR2_003054 [Camellia fascicularis]
MVGEMVRMAVVGESGEGGDAVLGEVVRGWCGKYNLLHEHELIEMNHNIEKLRQTYNELLEFKMVLQKASGFPVSSKSHAVAEERELDDHVYSNDDYADTASLLEQEMRHEPSNQSGLRFISGIISKSKLLRFERMLFRATRGNMLFNQAPADEPILDPVTTEMLLGGSYDGGGVSGDGGESFGDIDKYLV